MSVQQRYGPVGFASRGMSLIEVVAALAVLGVLTTGLVHVQTACERQWRTALDTQEAVSVVDTMLGQWLSEGGVPVDAVGTIVSRPGWRWRTERVRPFAIGEASLEQVRVRIERIGDDRELTAIDVLQALAPPKNGDG